MNKLLKGKYIMPLFKLLIESRLFEPPYSDEEDADGSFSPKLPKEEKEGLKAYHGRNVIWYGREGDVIRMDANDVYPIDGNIFYPSKIASVKKMIKQSDDKVELSMGYGFPKVVDITDIAESIEYADDNMHEPFTIEDEELDNYLGGENNDYFSDEFPTISKFVDAKFLYIAEDHETEEENEKNFKEFLERKVDEDDREEAEGEYEDWVNMELEIKDAIENEYGDIGRIIMQVRDGNHRTFGAIDAGEDYIYLHIEVKRKDAIPQEILNKLI